MTQRNNHRTRLIKGMTLIEVLVATTVMSIFIFGVGGLMVTGYHNARENDKTEEAFRIAASGLNLMGRDLRMSDELLSPTPTEWPLGKPYIPEKGIRPPFTTRCYSSALNRTIAVSYAWDSTTKKVERLIYPAEISEDPDAMVLEPLSRKVIIGNAQNFEIQRSTLTESDDLFESSGQLLKIKVNLALDSGSVPLSLQVWAEQL